MTLKELELKALEDDKRHPPTIEQLKIRSRHFDQVRVAEAKAALKAVRGRRANEQKRKREW